MRPLVRTRTKFLVAALFASGIAAAWPRYKEVLLDVAHEKSALERLEQKARALQQRHNRQPLPSARIQKEAMEITNEVVAHSIQINKTLPRLILPVFSTMLSLLGAVLFLGFGIMDKLRTFSQGEPDPLRDRKDA